MATNVLSAAKRSIYPEIRKNEVRNIAIITEARVSHIGGWQGGSKKEDAPMSRPLESTVSRASVHPAAAESTKITRYRSTNVDGLKPEIAAIIRDFLSRKLPKQVQ